MAQAYLPARAGSLQPELLAATRRAGLIAWTLSPRLPALLHAIADGRPVLVLQNLSLAALPLWHYAVLIGYDLPAQTVWLHSGPQAATPVSIHAFERTWVRGGSWAMIGLDPGAPPTDADPLAWLRAAAALHRSQPAAARAAYEAATSRWPTVAQTWFAAGTAALDDAGQQDAERALRRALALDPDYADAWNNLAVSLGRQGRVDEALEAVRRALVLQPDRRPAYEATRDELRALPPPAR